MNPTNVEVVNRALLAAVADADVAAVRSAIAQGAEVNAFIPVKSRAFMGARMGTVGTTPLGIAIREREQENTFANLAEYPEAAAREREAEARRKRAALLEVIEALVTAGADLHLVATPYQRVSPLCAAAANNDVEALEIFIRHGAKLRGTGALHMAAAEGSLDAVKVLVSAGAEVNETIQGRTALEMLEARRNVQPEWELNVGEEIAAEMAKREEEKEERRRLIREYLRAMSA